MSNIESRIAAWRFAMTQQFSVRSEVLDELEGHLRDDVDALSRKGHSLEAAVEAAMTRLGDPYTLAAEFAKVAISSPWLPVSLASAGGPAIAAMLIMPLRTKFAAGGITSLLATHMGLVMLGYLATLMVGFLAICYFLARPFRDLSEGQGRTLKRASLILTGMAVTLTATGILFGSLFCPNDKTGWAFGLDTREVGGLAILAFNVVMLSAFWRYRRATELKRLMLLGLMGNAAVILGWLGASAFEQQLHGDVVDYTKVVALLVAQLAIATLALAPASRLWSERV